MDIIEKRVQELSERVAEIDKKFENTVRRLQEYIVSLGLVVSDDALLLADINWFWNQHQGTTEYFDHTIETVKRKESELEKIFAMKLECPCLDSKATLGNVIEIARRWQIPFEQIASYLIEKLGKKLARELVKREDIMKNYGKEVLPIWKSLLEETS